MPLASIALTLLAATQGPTQFVPPTATSVPEIVGGTPVDEGEWLQVVALELGNFRCTGTLLAPTLVLTAAHCIPQNLNVSDVKVGFGNDDASLVGTLSATAVDIHPEFCAECSVDRMDFAYIVLESAANLPPIPLVTSQATYDTLMSVSASVTLVGFGEDENGTSGIKREVQTVITDHSRTGQEFEAGGDGFDSCQGDSGGPALVIDADGQPRLAGVLSRGFDCGEGGFYGNPYAIACWLRAETGVDLSETCEACDCVNLASHNGSEEGCGGCSAASPADHRNSTAPLHLLTAWLLLGRVRRRTRSRRAFDAPVFPPTKG